MTPKPILVTSYVNPDLDGVAGVIAYAELLQKTGHNVVAGIFGEPHIEAKYLLDRFSFEYPKNLESTDDFDEIILVDASELSVLDGKIPLHKVIEIIDHRKNHEAEKFPNVKAQIELVGAAATLVAEKFMENRIEISFKSAVLLYGAIISNTLNFNGITTERDRRAARWLNQTAKLPDSFPEELFTAKSDLSGNKLFEILEHDLGFVPIGGNKVGIAQIEMIGAQDLTRQREPEIISELKKIQERKNFNFLFLNTIDLKEYLNIFVTSHEPTKRLLEKVLEVKFSGNFAVRPNVIMRKQIIPLLKSELGK